MIVATLALAGCGAPGASPSPAPKRVQLGVSNGTTLDVSLFVNGQLVRDYPAGAPVPTIDPASLPVLPWTVEARSPLGRVLTSMTVESGQITTTILPNSVQRTGAMGRVDLSCGRLTIWAGDVMPSGPVPPPSPGTPGDCLP